MSELLKLLRNAGVIVLSLFAAFGMGFVVASDIFIATFSEVLSERKKFRYSDYAKKGRP